MRLYAQNLPKINTAYLFLNFGLAIGASASFAPTGCALDQVFILLYASI